MNNELLKEILELLNLDSLVTIANICNHITPEEAGLHKAEIARDIVRLFRSKAKVTTIGPERSVPKGTEILFFLEDELNI